MNNPSIEPIANPGIAWAIGQINKHFEQAGKHRNCPRCNGAGKYVPWPGCGWDVKCNPCNGTGRAPSVLEFNE